MDRSDRAEKFAVELDRRIAAANGQPSSQLLAQAQHAVSAEWAGEVQYGDDGARTEADHTKWQAIHRYIQSIPYYDRSDAPRSAHWQQILPRIELLSEVELIEWVRMKMTTARRLEASGGGAAHHPAPTYLVLLNNVANRERRAHTSFKWARMRWARAGLAKAGVFMKRSVSDWRAAALKRQSRVRKATFRPHGDDGA